MYSLSDFDFELPPDRIAQIPLAERRASRLLQINVATDAPTDAPTGCAHEANGMQDRHFSDILDQFHAGDVLVFNDTRVLKARLFGVKASGGKVEVLVERPLQGERVLAQVRASKSPPAGTLIRLADAFDVTVLGREGEFYVLQFPESVFDLLERHGQLPLPPYIERGADDFDDLRYQTVYAKNLGAVAAPTAGLHFDADLLAQLAQKGVVLAYVTLHVGAGTFQPVRVEDLSQHQMHSEWYQIPEATAALVAKAQTAGRQVVAVGTTSLRALESASQSGSLQAGCADTKLFITPGYQFKTVTRLITNFHLPKSTLLMLVSAFAGYATIRRAYAHAIAHDYRFFSYGDAMLLTRNCHP